LRKTLTIGIGAAGVALAATTAAGVASASASHHASSAARDVAAVSTVNRHVTATQAARIAKAKVAHSRVHEIESDDLHGRAVWKVQLSTPHGRVTVDVDKKTGRAIIVPSNSGRGRGPGHALATAAVRSGHDARDARDNDAADDRGRDAVDHDAADNDAADDRGQDAADNDAADDRGQDAVDNDAAGDLAEHHGDQRHQGDQRGHDAGDDNGSAGASGPGPSGN
jgi:hypothetical protein